MSQCGASCTGNGGHCGYDALWEGACYWHSKLRPGGMPVAETISEMQRLLTAYSWHEAQQEARVRGIKWLVELGETEIEVTT